MYLIFLKVLIEIIDQVIPINKFWMSITANYLYHRIAFIIVFGRVY